jgi:hypothetical protein
VRIAIISSPRSGNSWLAAVLSTALRLRVVAVHNPTDIPLRRFWLRYWGTKDTGTLDTQDTYIRHFDLAPRPNIILQLHWYREPNLQAFLGKHRFRVISVARHPLDVLVSAWRFRKFHREVTRWLEGNVNLPLECLNEPPSSPAFLRYATSFGAENLLGISYQWWHDPDVIRARYEECVKEPLNCFRSLCTELGGEPGDISAILQKFTVAYFRDNAGQHGWQGRPSLWRELIPWDHARSIYQHHQRVFEDLGYELGTPTCLSLAQATANWRTLDGQS